MPHLLMDTHPDRPTGGFDPYYHYQMIPLGGSRGIIVRMGDVPARLRLTNHYPAHTVVSKMSNFTILKTDRAKTLPLPGPGTYVQEITLPERSDVMFSLSGANLGTAMLEGWDVPPGRLPLDPDVSLVISVKPKHVRHFAVCYAFDRIHRDTGARADFDGLFLDADRVFSSQANFSIVNVDGHSASTQQARTVTINGTMGRKFEVLHRPLLARVVDGFDAKFPGVFGKVHAVVFVVNVPLTIDGDDTPGVTFLVERTSSGRRFIFVLATTVSMRPHVKQGGGISDKLVFRQTIAHEIGHSLGLTHDPDKEPPLLKDKKGRKRLPNPKWYKYQTHNLMFPTQLITSNRITAPQVEVMHTLGPRFRQLDF